MSTSIMKDDLEVWSYFGDSGPGPHWKGGIRTIERWKSGNDGKPVQPRSDNPTVVMNSGGGFLPVIGNIVPAGQLSDFGPYGPKCASIYILYPSGNGTQVIHQYWDRIIGLERVLIPLILIVRRIQVQAGLRNLRRIAKSQTHPNS
jgi:hypothetical protein